MAGKRRYNGHIDVDITENGVQQMHRLAGLLAGKGLSAVYSSDLIRSVKGARIIAGAAGISLYASSASCGNGA